MRELGLPREALLNVIVRGERAIPPRGSTIIQEGDQLHVLVRQEVAVEFRELMRRWRTGPVGPPERPRRQPRSRPSVTSIRPVADPTTAIRSARRSSSGNEVIEQLRTRRDEPGALVVLEDGRFARLRPAAGDRPVRRAAGVRPPPAGERHQPGRAGLVAGGRRRAGALGRRRACGPTRARAVGVSAAVAMMNSRPKPSVDVGDLGDVGDLRAGADGGGDAARAVRVHDHDRPVAGPDVPGQRVRRPGRPRMSCAAGGPGGAGAGDARRSVALNGA